MNDPTAPKKFDMEKLTLGELAMVESLSGQSFADFGSAGVPMGKTLAALAMMAKRRAGDPKFQFGDALAIPMDEAMALIGMDDAKVPDAGDDDSDDDGEAAAKAIEAEIADPTKSAKPKSPPSA